MTSINTQPLPRFVEPGHFSIDSDTLTLVSYDLTFDAEHDCWECSCQGFYFNRTCKHVLRLAAQLAGVRIEVQQARQSIKARGVKLEDLFNYDNPTPPTHHVTNRSKVAAPR